MAPSPRTIVASAAALGAALVVAAACKRAASSDQAPPSSPPLASKPFYRLDAGPAAPCAAGTTCEATLVLTALGAYHVNKDYPTKFLATSPLDGAPAFALTDATHGTMTVRFKPPSPGTTTLTGTFKLSVCSDDTCEIEQPQISLPVAVR
jgi:hypothetical protein